MEPADATLRILQKIQEGITGLREDIAGLRGDVNRLEQHAASTNERLASLEQHASTTSSTLQVMNDRMAFFERVSTVAMEARSRLDDRVDRLEARMDELESRSGEHA